jgi:hypothetical protein
VGSRFPKDGEKNHTRDRRINSESQNLFIEDLLNGTSTPSRSMDRCDISSEHFITGKGIIPWSLLTIAFQKHPWRTTFRNLNDWPTSITLENGFFKIKPFIKPVYL